MLLFPCGVPALVAAPESTANSPLFPSNGFPPSGRILPAPDQQKPSAPLLIRRPCPLLPVEMIREGYAGCPTAADLLNRFREDHCFLSNRHFNRYSLYSSRNANQNGHPPNPGIFFIQDDFPEHMPEIACIIHRYGDGLYKERIFFFQRMEKRPETWRKIVHFNLSDPIMPWGGAFGGIRARLVALTPDSVAIPVESVKDGRHCGDIVFRFRLKDGIYKSRGVVISESAMKTPFFP